MKKILCLIDGFTLGGAERQLIGLASLLKQNGYEVELGSYIESDFYTKLISECGLNHTILKVKQNALSKLLAVRSHIRKNNYDVIIAYKDGPTIISCLIKLFRAKFKLIVSERNTTQNLSKKDYIKFWLYRFSDYIVPNSYSQEKFIRSHYPKLGIRTITITNFTDIEHFQPAKNNHHDRLIILTAARIARQKNILNYISAVKKVVDRNVHLRFVWYGDIQKGQEEYGKECMNRIKELNLESIFEFRPASKNILTEYQNCDVFCLPSIYEGYPNVICEAMSCGKPIICSNVCDNPFIVEKNKNGYMFNPYDVDDIKNKILKICSLSYSERLLLGKYSRKIAEERFSEKMFVNKYIKLIESKCETNT